MPFALGFETFVLGLAFAFFFAMFSHLFLIDK